MVTVGILTNLVSSVLEKDINLIKSQEANVVANFTEINVVNNTEKEIVEELSYSQKQILGNYSFFMGYRLVNHKTGKTVE
jgi:hypothetical protein